MADKTKPVHKPPRLTDTQMLSLLATEFNLPVRVVASRHKACWPLAYALLMPIRGTFTSRNLEQPHIQADYMRVVALLHQYCKRDGDLAGHITYMQKLKKPSALSMHALAKAFGVPTSTLHDRVYRYNLGLYEALTS